MMRVLTGPGGLFSAALVAAFLVFPPGGVAQSDLPSAGAEDFMGSWRVTLQSDMGPLALSIDIRDVEGRVSVEVGSDMGRDEVTDVTRVDEALVLRFAADAQGQPIDVHIQLRRDGESLRTAVTAGGGMFAANGMATRAQ